MTRGTQANTAYIATGEAVPGQEPELVQPEVVLAEIMDNAGTGLTATEAIRQAQEWSAGAGYLVNIWAASMRDTVKAAIDSKLKEHLEPHEYQRYLREPQRQPLQQALRERELNGENVNALIDRITAGDLKGRQEHLSGPVRAPVTRRAPRAYQIAGRSGPRKIPRSSRTKLPRR